MALFRKKTNPAANKTTQSTQETGRQTDSKTNIWKKTWSFLLKFKIVIIVAALLVCLMPKIYSTETEVGMRAVITSLGIDKSDEAEFEYELTAQVFIPNNEESKSQKKTMVSIKSDNIAEVADKMTLKTGRVTEIAHCGLILIGKALFDEGCLDSLDFIMRSGSVSWGAVIMGTDSTAKETLSKINTLEEKASFSWQRYLNTIKRTTQNTSVDLKTFMNESYSVSKSTYISILNMVEADSGTGDEGSGGGQNAAAIYTASGSGSEGGGEAPGQIDERVKLYIVQEGKKVGELDEKETAGILWLDKEAIKKTIQLENVETSLYGDGKVAVEMRNKRLRQSFSFRDGKPHMKIRVDAVFNKVEAAGSYQKTITNKQRTEAQEALAKKLNEKMNEDLRLTLNKCIEAEADCMEIINNFHRFCFKEYKKYMETHTMIDLLRELELDAKLNVKIKM